LENSASVRDIELGLPERRRDLILNHFHTRARADDVLTDFDGFELANVETNRRIELERATARRRFGTSEHDANFLA